MSSVKAKANTPKTSSSTKEPGTFFVVDHDWFDTALEHLKPHEFRLLTWWARLEKSRNNGRLHASYRYLSDKFGQGHSTTAKALRGLQDKGFIRSTELGYWRLTFVPVLDEETREVCIPATNEWKALQKPKRLRIGNGTKRSRTRNTTGPELGTPPVQIQEPYIDGKNTRLSEEKMPPEGGPPTANAVGVPDEKVLDSAMATDSEPKPHHCIGRNLPIPQLRPDPLPPADGGRHQNPNPVAVDCVSSEVAAPLRRLPNGLCRQCGKRGEVNDYGGMLLLHFECVAPYEADERERGAKGETLDF